jgi:hypothetical protein
MRLRDMSQRKSVVIVQKHKWNSTVLKKKRKLKYKVEIAPRKAFPVCVFLFSKKKKKTIVAQNNEINKLQS